MTPEMLKGGALPGLCAAAVVVICAAIPALTTLANPEIKHGVEGTPAYVIIMSPSSTLQDTDTGVAPRVFSAVMVPLTPKAGDIKMNPGDLAALEISGIPLRQTQP